jgi:hypothetical protein
MWLDSTVALHSPPVENNVNVAQLDAPLLSTFCKNYVKLARRHDGVCL